MSISKPRSFSITTSPLQPMRPSVFRICRIRQEIANTFTMSVEVIDERDTTLRFLPGQFSMLYVFGQGEVPISISGDPQNEREWTQTIRAVGPVTCALQRQKPGECIGVRGPFGSAWPLHDAMGKDIVLMAGGLGLAPLRPIVYHWLAHREQYGRLLLFYATRMPETILFRQELEAWQSEPGMEIGITVDRAGNQWPGKFHHGSVGVITHLLEGVNIHPQNTMAMICGPEPMMRFCANTLNDMGIVSANIYLSMERNMKCAVGFCGHCQYGPYFLCKEGPVFPYSSVENWLRIREV